MKECLRLITERRSITFFDLTNATAPSGYNLQPQREPLPRAYRFKFEEFGRFL
jgi:hypothetical protein